MYVQLLHTIFLIKNQLYIKLLSNTEEFAFLHNRQQWPRFDGYNLSIFFAIVGEVSPGIYWMMPIQVKVFFCNILMIFQITISLFQLIQMIIFVHIVYLHICTYWKIVYVNEYGLCWEAFNGWDLTRRKFTGSEFGTLKSTRWTFIRWELERVRVLQVGIHWYELNKGELTRWNFLYTNYSSRLFDYFFVFSETVVNKVFQDISEKCRCSFDNRNWRSTSLL